jgi:hypothetical protein
MHQAGFHEECGLFGVYGRGNVVDLIYYSTPSNTLREAGMSCTAARRPHQGPARFGHLLESVRFPVSESGTTAATTDRATKLQRQPLSSTAKLAIAQRKHYERGSLRREMERTVDLPDDDTRSSCT